MGQARISDTADRPTTTSPRSDALSRSRVDSDIMVQHLKEEALAPRFQRLVGRNPLPTTFPTQSYNQTFSKVQTEKEGISELH